MHGKSLEGYMTFAVTSRQGYLLSFVLAAKDSDAHKKVKEILKHAYIPLNPRRSYVRNTNV